MGAREECDFFEYPLRGELVHAVEVAERTDAFKAGATGKAQADDARFVGQWRREGGAGGAKQRDHWRIERGGDVHQTGIVDDSKISGCDEVNGLIEGGFAAQILRHAIALLPDGFSDLSFFGEPSSQIS